MAVEKNERQKQIEKLQEQEDQLEQDKYKDHDGLSMVGEPDDIHPQKPDGNIEVHEFDQPSQNIAKTEEVMNDEQKASEVS